MKSKLGSKVASLEGGKNCAEDQYRADQDVAAVVNSAIRDDILMPPKGAWFVISYVFATVLARVELLRLVATSC